jgi:hypothetical protein
MEMKENIEQFLEHYASDCNYFEFCILSNDTPSCNEEPYICLNTSLSKTMFYNMMYRMMDTSYKYYQKQYKELVIGTTVYQNSKNEDISTFSISTNAVRIYGRVAACAQNKSKLSILSLPSTRNIYKEALVKKLTFRVTNRVFVNFEHGDENDTRYYRVTINYNHDKDVDTTGIINVLDDILKVLVEPTC